MKISIIILLLLLGIDLYSQNAISGYVKDNKTGEVIQNAIITNTENNIKTYSDIYGYFSISYDSICPLSISHIGYQTKEYMLVSKTDNVLTILLNKGSKLSGVNILATKTTFNTAQLSVVELKSIPSLGGTADVLKAMQLLPGIQGQNEGSSSLIVRGGSPGQNLYLLDNTPLIYVNHLGGFLSVFNPDMIHSISIIKGGFSPKYGGKLSSVVAISQRSGDTSQFKGSLGIGITDINLSLEGPLGKKVSYMFTARKTLFGLLMYAGTAISEANSATVSYGFHDINAKITWRLNNKNKIFFNAYQGDDYVRIKSKKNSIYYEEPFSLKNTWGNMLFSADWNHIANNRLFGKTTASYTKYRLSDKQEVGQKIGDPNINNFTSSINDVSLRSEWKYSVSPKYIANFGIHSSFLNHSPYELETKSNKGNSYHKESTKSLKNALFINNIFKLNKSIKLDIGLRAISYSIADYSKIYLEPRLSVNFNIKSRYKLNISYTQMNQSSHLLFIPGANIMATEVWVPASAELPPSKSQQASIGLSTYIKDNMFMIESAVYYKNMTNLSTYKEGFSNLKTNSNWLKAIETGGNGISYGLELFIKKKQGKWTGSLGYNWSYTTRQFDNINNGKTYLYEYHRPHSISLMINRKINKKWSFNMVWVYQTGIPYTPAIGRQYAISPGVFNQSGDVIYKEALIYGERNSKRMKDYHRLDIGFKYSKLTKNLKLKTEWSFSIYNLYSRQNPSMYYYNTNASDEIMFNADYANNVGGLKLYQFSAFPFIPSVSYKVYFNVPDLKKIKESSKRWLYNEN